MERESMDNPSMDGVSQTILDSEDDTLAFGAQLSTTLNKGGLVFLHGDLGAGKTTLARGLLRALGYDGAIRSPTYTLVERYPTKIGIVCHYDLYRMSDAEELEFLGAREDFGSGNLCLIEWPERGVGWLGEPVLDVYLTFSSQPHESTKKIGRQIELKWQNRRT
jgi:tRNA threonylcarbamoyladenosine biosynthesis protein TsaE